MTGYLAVFEHDNDGWSVYLPDLPGCVGTGTTRSEAQQAITAAVALHIEGLRSAGLPVPEPSAEAGEVIAA